LIKRILGISKICHHSQLLQALSFNNFSNTIKISKLKLVNRLIDNVFTRQVFNNRAIQQISNQVVHINDLWRDTWLYTEELLDETFDLNDVRRINQLLVKNEKLKFTNLCKHDEMVNTIRNILKIDQFQIRRMTLHDLLIPLAVRLNDSDF